MNQTTWTAFEREVTGYLLAGSVAQLAQLREQLAMATVAKRVETGVGFYVDLNVPARLPTVVPAEFYLPDVLIELREVRYGARAILLIAAGRLAQLEVATLDDPWPAKPEIVSWRYDPVPRALPFG